MSTPLSIPDAIERAATCWPDRIAVQIPEGESFKTLTYAEVIDRFRKQAKQLIKTGIKPGDRIVLLAENGPEWAVACLSALAAGATVVPLDGALSPPDLEDLIRRADPRALMLTQAQHEALAPSSRFGLPVYNIENQLSPFEENGHQPADTSSTTDPDLEAALLIFTSGTTGDSKGILLGHQGLLHTARACFQAIELDAQEPLRVLCVLPLHHVTGFTVTFLGPLLEGGTVTFVEALNAQAILEAMQKSQTTILPAIPRLFELFHTEIHRKVQAKGAVARKTFGSLVAFCATVRRFTPWNPGPVIFRTVHEAFGGSLRLCCSGAAPLPLEVLHGLENLGFNVIEAYGLTEASGVSTINSVSNRRPGTVGLPISDTEIQIANATPSTSEGEICIRGPVQMHRYFRDESTTSQVIRDGWLRTGDLGKIDHRGYLTVTGRLKELIVTSGGKNVSPADVERRYSDLPGVAELAVFGMPAKEGFGEEVHAAFVPDATTPAESSQQAVETAVQERAADIPAHMRIQGIHILSELPKTTTFKVKRGELKQLEASKASGTETRKADPNSPLDEVSQQVLTVVHEAMRQSEDPSQVTLDATLQFELGFDSLGLIELAARIENHFNGRTPFAHFVHSGGPCPGCKLSSGFGRMPRQPR